MKKYISAIALALLIGCAQPPSSHLSPVGNGIGRIDGDINAATNSVDQAKPHTDQIGNAHLADATFSLTDAKTQIVTTTKALTASQIATDKIIKDDQQTHDLLAAERNHWVGYRTRVLARSIICISLTVWVGIGLLYAVTSVSPIAWLSPIVLEIERLLPFMNPFEWLASWLQSRKAKATTPASTVTPSV